MKQEIDSWSRAKTFSSAGRLLKGTTKTTPTFMPWPTTEFGSSGLPALSRSGFAETVSGS